MLDWWDNEFLINNQLRGCFIGDVSCPDLNNHIFLLYRYTGDRWFQRYEQELRNTEYFIDSYEPNKLYTMYVYEVPEWQRYNMEMFRASKFSSLDDGFKKHIVTFHGEDKTIDLVSVMYKHESAYLALEKKINAGLPKSQWTKIPRDVEPSRLLNMEEELYDSSKIKFKEDEPK
jgi:hypothetical protein